MTTSLIDSLNQVATPDFAARVASQLGEKDANVTRGLSGGFSSTLMGLLTKSGDSSSMEQIFGLVSNTANDGSVLDNPASLLEPNAATSPIGGLGRQFLSSIFGTRAPAVNEVIAKSSGLGVGSVASLMKLAAPLVLGVLGKRVRDGGLNVASFTSMLTGERKAVETVAVAGVAGVLGAVPRTTTLPPEAEAPRMETPRRERVRTEEPVGAYAQPAPEERSGGGSGWRWALATVAALLLLWAVWPRNRHQVATAPDTTHTGYAGGEVTPPAAAVTPGMVKLALPNGTTIEVPENGPEASLVAFLKDPSRHADDTTWFELTQMQFETNSATLKPESDAQLKNIALIMQAYPNASARIGGYTDNTGNAAANKRLSQERASNVRLALVNLGVGAAHLTAEGYGPEHPIADNSTEEGRAHNRRIALRVTQK